MSMASRQQASGSVEGGLACGSAGSDAAVVWTSDRDLLLAVARGDIINELFQLWSDYGSAARLPHCP